MFNSECFVLEIMYAMVSTDAGHAYRSSATFKPCFGTNIPLVLLTPKTT